MWKVLPVETQTCHSSVCNIVPEKITSNLTVLWNFPETYLNKFSPRSREKCFLKITFSKKIKTLFKPVWTLNQGHTTTYIPSHGVMYLSHDLSCLCLSVRPFCVRTPWHIKVPQDAASVSLAVCLVPADAGPAASGTVALAFVRNVPGHVWLATYLVMHQILRR